MEKIEVKNEWPDSISDGLECKCAICGKPTNIDYKLVDELWLAIAPQNKRTDVICIDCIDKLAVNKGYDISEGLIEIQYTGINKTIVLKPIECFYY